MAYYQIITTPGKELAYPLTEEDTPLRSQDEAKIVVARLRAEARAEGKKIDFVVKRDETRSTSPSSGSGAAQGTSVRLSEDNRRKLARYVGLLMYETGDAISMGDAVARLVDHYESTKHLASDDQIVARAREIRATRKAEADRAAEAAA